MKSEGEGQSGSGSAGVYTPAFRVKVTFFVNQIEMGGLGIKNGKNEIPPWVLVGLTAAFQPK